MKTFFMSDIHGHFEEMIKLLKYSSFNPERDKLIIGGDMVSRGDKAALVLKYLKKLQEKYPDNVVVLKGNHELMMERYLLTGKSTMWLNYGAYETLASFNNDIGSEGERWELINWSAELPLIHLDDDYAFCHAGLDFATSLQNQTDNILWVTKSELEYYDREEVFKYLHGRPLVHGHTPTKSVTDDGIIISCDLGAGSDGYNKLALVNLTDNFYYAVDCVSNVITEHPIMQIE